MAKSGRKSTAKTRGAKSEKSAFASPREKADFQKRLDAERESSTIISNQRRQMQELGITVGVGQSSSDVSGGSIAGTTSTPSTGSAAASLSGASGTGSSSTGSRR